jgi:hypothetical protein
MYVLPHIKHNSRVGKVAIALAVITIGATITGEALAAGHGPARGTGELRGTFGGPVSNPPPSMAPTFNPSYRYTVPQTPETPVSPASPGSVFGNG